MDADFEIVLESCYKKSFKNCLNLDLEAKLVSMSSEVIQNWISTSVAYP